MTVGAPVGDRLGEVVGETLGVAVGETDGAFVGATVGLQNTRAAVKLPPTLGSDSARTLRMVQQWEALLAAPQNHNTRAAGEHRS